MPPPSEELSRVLAEVLDGDPTTLITEGYKDKAPNEIKELISSNIGSGKAQAFLQRMGRANRYRMVIDLIDTLKDGSYLFTADGEPISEERRANILESLGRPLPKPISSTPILGTIRAGLPILAEENYEGELDIPADIEADFALRVVGDSMSGVGIYEGDYAICRQAQEANRGDIVVALRDDAGESAATLKFYCHDNGKEPMLRAANPNYEDIDMKDGYRIGGILVAQLRKEPPPYHIYKDFISAKYAGYEGWVEAIETATQCGISPRQVKDLIELQWDMAKRMAGKK
jgi:repressor LexA